MKQTLAQQVWRVGLLMILGLAAVIMNKVYIFQTDPHFDHLREGTPIDFLIYSLPFSAIFTIVDLTVHRVFDPIVQNNYINLAKWTDPVARKKKCYTLVKCMFSAVFYLCSSLWAYRIMAAGTLLPPWLGGKGSFYVLAQEFPRVPSASWEMKAFYLMELGKHLSRFFSHVFIRSEGNFFEYALHHGMSVFLIMFSYLTNQWNIGVFVLLVHDASDFGILPFLTYRDYKKCYKPVLYVITLFSYINWVTCRNILFPYSIYTTFTSGMMMIEGNTTMSEYELSAMLYPFFFEVFMLACLEVLHVFWTYKMTKAILSEITGKKKNKPIK